MPVRRILKVVVGLALIAVVTLFVMGILQVRAAGVFTNRAKVEETTGTDPYSKAALLYTAFKYSEALNAYREALAADPKHEKATDAEYFIARCQEQLGDTKAAIAGYQAFLRTNPYHDLAPQAKKYLALLGGEIP